MAELAPKTPKKEGKSTGRGSNPEFVAQQWKPGQSGNVKGRPPGRSVWKIAEEILDQRSAPRSRKTKREALIEIVVEMALSGRIDAITLLLRRLWPEVQQHQVEGNLGLAAEVKDAAAEFKRRITHMDDDDLLRRMQQVRAEARRQYGNGEDHAA